jgi:phage protein D
MNNQYDIVFLLQLARKQNYSVYMEVNPETGKERLYFGPAEVVRDITYELQWGRSLTSFQPTLTTARQVSSVTVRGWDRRAGKPIEYTAKLGDKEVPINRDLDAVAQSVAGRQEIIVDQPVYTKDEAKRLAVARLSQRQEEIVKGNAATVGLPDLRAGSKVHILKLGPRFSGVYYVTDSTHTIGDNGYRTTFNARREAGVDKPKKGRQ